MSKPAIIGITAFIVVMYFLFGLTIAMAQSYAEGKHCFSVSVQLFDSIRLEKCSE